MNFSTKVAHLSRAGLFKRSICGQTACISSFNQSFKLVREKNDKNNSFRKTMNGPICVLSDRSFSQSSKLNSNIFNVQDEADFKKRVLENSKPVIVDFHAVWCGPCKILGPRLEKLMAGYAGRADFAKVDIDQLSDLAFEYNVSIFISTSTFRSTQMVQSIFFKVSSVPTVVAIRNGKVVNKFIGLKDDDRLKAFVEDVVEK
jgi:thioredoxin-like negative regulator of GroEL